MTRDDDGEAAAVVIESHGHVPDRITGDDATGAEEEDGGRGDQPEPFFQCLDRAEAPSADDADPVFPSDDDEVDANGDDVRASFATAVGDGDGDRLEEELDEEEEDDEDVSKYDYGMWMTEEEPMSIQERRRLLLQGMGLNSSKDLLKSRNARGRPPHGRRSSQSPAKLAVITDDAPSTSTAAVLTRCVALTRCGSDSRLASRGGTMRKPPTFRRVYSVPHSLDGSPVHKALRPAARCSPQTSTAKRDGGEDNSSGDIGRSRTIKNLDDGKEFVVSGQTVDGSWGALSDVQTGSQVSIDDFERFIGYTPIVKQLMRRSQSQLVPSGASAKAGGAKPAKKKPRWLKNIKLVASAAGLFHEKDKDDTHSSGRWSALPSAASMSKSASTNSSMPSSSSERLKVHHYGKSSKELTGLYMRQEVRAHEGSIWTIKFSADGRFLASGGEDRLVRVWRVVDAEAQELTSTLTPSSSQVLPPLAPANAGTSAVPGLAAQLSKKVRRGKSGKHVLPEHVVVPETVFALDEEPACALEGHLDDVLDLSWSKSQVQLLLSSSMDKTVRLWDVEAKACLKLFTHNDYVTCIQFNPADDGYFISGSLDCKVRIWSVEERHVVDWSDLDDMVTAACYTPDGQAAIIGSHKGSCRFYKTTDCKLNQEAQIDMSISKKRKSQAKKITGFQFAPGNPSEILVTSADSQIRVFNGITVLQKFKGFKNTSSQISATYTADGRYVVCASEDSNVYVWRRAPGAGIAGIVKAKAWRTSRAYECFFCKDVSAAVPWPRSPSSPPPPPLPRSTSAHGGGVDAASRGAGQDCGGLPPRRPKSGPMTYPGVQAGMTRETSARWHGGAEGGNAWGMVVVTASLGGQIRVYQNFGLPLRIRGQGNLFH